MWLFGAPDTSVHPRVNDDTWTLVTNCNPVMN